ncbi:hypothetical protein [Rhodanobacter sp. C01]|uniref:hypothetical protein n=1 Tax=Rhodanobacter sp. C01 TaxID=1945856 RepID=UPI00098422CA|nr:hypothetical protein [Rhodanobacter sp. C01]OOG47983.1 hypothetical protein B0E50_11220 [Rhodanobacter sp. C01]
MSQLEIAGFVASLCKDSLHRRLIRAMKKLAPAEFAFLRIPIDGLPLYLQGFVDSHVGWIRRFAG